MKTIIIEDTPDAIELLTLILKRNHPTIEVVGHTGDIAEAIELITTLGPDLLLLDIEIIGGTSFDILDQLQKLNVPIDFQIVFMTGHREFDYPTMAFSYSAVDFMVKPIDEQQVARAIDRVLNRTKSPQYEAQIRLMMDFLRENDPKKHQQMALQLKNGKIQMIDLYLLNYLKANEAYTTFVFIDGSKLEAIRNLGHYAKILMQTSRFFSVSNSVVINLEQLKNYDHSEKIVTFKNGEHIAASKRGGQDLRNWLLNYGQ